MADSENTSCRREFGATADAGAPQSARWTKTRKSSSIDGLPEELLVEILCRLQCNKLVFQCKSVSKRWRTLIDSQHFIGRFVQHMQSSCKKPAKLHTLMDEASQEFPPTKTSSSNKLLTPMFEIIKSIHGSRAKPVVVATYNDLVVCCDRGHFQLYYYICNALTMEWVALPPAPSLNRCVGVGLICYDIPDYNGENGNWKLLGDQNNNNNNNIRRLNAAAECRCKVVRIICHSSFKLNVEIFSTETGEWTKSVVPCPRRLFFNNIRSYPFLYHGRIYGVADKFLRVHELKEQDGVAPGWRSRRNIEYTTLDPELFQNSDAYGLDAFDPYNKDSMYIKAGIYVIKCNIHTGECLKVDELWHGFRAYFYPVVIPWWPTPVPTLYGTMPHEPSLLDFNKRFYDE